MRMSRMWRPCFATAPKKMAPLWSLESFVTVNPYHGMIDSGFADVGERLESVAGARTTMPEDYYLDAYDRGEITDEALNHVLEQHEQPPAETAEAFIKLARGANENASPDATVPTVADVAAEHTERDWAVVEKEQVSDWAAAYFDSGQVSWNSTDTDQSIFQAWKREAQIDRTPEVLGLAGNSSFIVARRERTRGIDLEGRTFLHNYDWTRDDDFEVLELIMTAPMVVTTWISLQYYASTVENDLFGSGNKTLHNVVGRLGVYEGNAGDLRTGLPWQSIHDGETYQHIPLRQSVIIEAPIDPMNDIIERNETVRHLCDNNWLHLLKMGDDGTISYRYDGNLTWTEPAFSDVNE